MSQDESRFRETTKLDKAFLRGMKEKKIHEVERLSHLVQKINHDNDVDTIIDIGAGSNPFAINSIHDVGKGYISQVLAIQFGMNVINLEGQSTHNEGIVI